MGVSIELDTARGVEGHVTNGDNVAVFATFSPDTLIRKSDPRAAAVAGADPEGRSTRRRAARCPRQPRHQARRAVHGHAGPVRRASWTSRTRSWTNGQDLERQHQPDARPDAGRRHERRSTRARTRTSGSALLPPQNPQRLPLEASFGPSFNQVVGGAKMSEASVVAVGTPQSFRQQLARSLEVELEEVGWVQSATAAEELLIQALQPDRRAGALARGQGARRAGPGRVRGPAGARDGHRPGPRPHVERPASGRDARGHPRRGGHDAGHGGAPRRRRARHRVGRQPAVREGGGPGRPSARARPDRLGVLLQGRRRQDAS